MKDRELRELAHIIATAEQDRIFEHNAHLRQKIWGLALTLVSLGLWIYLTNYNVVQIWWGVELVPLALAGVWLMLTDRNLPWEWMWEEDE